MARSSKQTAVGDEPTVTKDTIQQYNSSATSVLARSSTPRPTNPQSVQYSTHLLLLQSSVFPALYTAVYAAVVEQWASNPEVDGAFCGRPWHPLHTQAICGGGDRSRLLTLGTTEPFACRCPNVNKMLQMCEKKNTKCDSSRSHFLRSDQFTLFKKTTTDASLRLYQIVICRKKRQKKSMFKRPLTTIVISCCTSIPGSHLSVKSKHVLKIKHGKYQVV